MKNFPMILLVALGSHANAACWKSISESNNAVISIDDCSIAKDGVYRKAWLKWDFNSLQETSDYPVKKYIQALTLDYFNCSTRKTASVQGIYRDEDGNTIKSESIQVGRVSFDEVAPETVAETYMNYVCKKKNR